MTTLLFLGLLLLAEGVTSALLSVRGCDWPRRMDNTLLSPLFTNVSYNGDDGLLKMYIAMDSLGYIVDVNETTNTYTTLHVRLEYVGDVIHDEYLRLCNYSRVLRADGEEPVSTTTSQQPSSTAHSSLINYSTRVPDMSDMIQKRDAWMEEYSPLLLDRAEETYDSCPIYEGDEVVVDLSLYIGHHSPFGTYSLDVTVINSDANHTVIGCSLAKFSTVQKRSLQNFMVAFTALLLSLIILSNILGYQLSPYIDTQNPLSGLHSVYPLHGRLESPIPRFLSAPNGLAALGRRHGLATRPRRQGRRRRVRVDVDGRAETTSGLWLRQRRSANDMVVVPDHRPYLHLDCLRYRPRDLLAGASAEAQRLPPHIAPLHETLVSNRYRKRTCRFSWLHRHAVPRIFVFCALCSTHAFVWTAGDSEQPGLGHRHRLASSGPLLPAPDILCGAVRPIQARTRHALQVDQCDSDLAMGLRASENVCSVVCCRHFPRKLRVQLCCRRAAVQRRHPVDCDYLLGVDYSVCDAVVGSVLLQHGNEQDQDLTGHRQAYYLVSAHCVH
ncbi:hypothetical protein KL933_004079 [Ogataea haglerorum]|uniref:Uncharacterized protein n=1 Tax=Ogataea haglerorum TaxID=1937702 RepID=A0AAN6HZG2_9ASCO|nr:hypothetical protein KL933_004079 [Ogataea haglerorum]KAG7746619.1 hypothetical protein KL912_004196 [Ogataea haglerorum]KAG7765677.1 hypothetical protein KL931_004328 [Ogataea haglerorum]KAG7798928.1 hypothetical protein KL944_004327 [Ogataea haglerorum]